MILVGFFFFFFIYFVYIIVHVTAIKQTMFETGSKVGNLLISLMLAGSHHNDDALWIGVCAGLMLDLHPANERRRYKVTPSLIGWVQT